MLASPINPSDLATIRGQYGRQPTLPATPGYEGVGVVEEGHGLLAWRVKGKRVAVLNGAGGNWAEQVVIPARQAVPVPAALSDEQADLLRAAVEVETVEQAHQQQRRDDQEEAEAEKEQAERRAALARLKRCGADGIEDEAAIGWLEVDRICSRAV